MSEINLTLSKKSFMQWVYIDKGGVFVFLAVLMSITMLVPCVIMRMNGTVHVTTILPTISESGGSPPQSGVFSALIAVTFNLNFWMINYMHMVILLQCQKSEIKNIHTVNFLHKCLIACGYGAVIGAIIVGAFPVEFQRNSKNWLFVEYLPHMCGAIPFYYSTFSYFALHANIMHLLGVQGKILRFFRFISMGIIMCCFAVTTWHMESAFNDYKSNDYNRPTVCILGFKQCTSANTIIAVCQWVTATAHVLLTFSFAADMKRFPNIIVFTVSEKVVHVSETADVLSVDDPTVNRISAEVSVDRTKKKFRIIHLQ